MIRRRFWRMSCWITATCWGAVHVKGLPVWSSSSADGPWISHASVNSYKCPDQDFGGQTLVKSLSSVFFSFSDIPYNIWCNSQLPFLLHSSWKSPDNEHVASNKWTWVLYALSLDPQKLVHRFTPTCYYCHLVLPRANPAGLAWRSHPGKLSITSRI